MLSRLLNASGAPPGKEATERNNPAARQPAGSPRWSSVALIFIGLGLIAGAPFLKAQYPLAVST